KTQLLSDEDRELLNQVEGRPAIVVENKSDLQPTRRDSRPRLCIRAEAGTVSSTEPPSPPHIPTSALTGEGIPALRAAILHHVAGDSTTTQESGFLTSVRHQKLVNDALTSLDTATKAVVARVPHKLL